MKSRAAGAAVLALGSLMTAAFAAGDIAVSPTSVSFGDLCVGETSSPRPITIQNGSADEELEISGLSLSGGNASDFSLTSLSPPSPIQPGGSATFSVRFKPSVRLARSSEVHIDHSDENETDPFPVDVTGVGRDRRIASDRPTVSFGNQRVGTRSPNQSLLIRNPGGDAITVTSITKGGANGAEFVLISPPATPLVISPGAAAAVNVAFQPSGIGLRNGALQVASNACGQATLSVSLVGSGVVPNVTVAPNPIDVGAASVGSEGPPTAVTISNDGGAVLKITALQIIGPNAADFALSGVPALPASVQQNESFVFSIRMLAAEQGNRQATLNIVSDDPDAPAFAVPLRGVAGTPSPSPSPTVSASPSPTSTASPTSTSKPRAAAPGNPNDALAIILVVLVVALAFAGLVVARKMIGSKEEDD